jgi:DNA (cytosine-5)-methyltransferase 1
MSDLSSYREQAEAVVARHQGMFRNADGEMDIGIDPEGEETFCCFCTDEDVIKPRLLDLFCGAGGASMGYHRAGFEVVGVDINSQPNYPFEFHQGDAMTWPLEGFDAISASPPCQAYSTATADHSKHPDLYSLTRDRLIAAGVPYAIENVIGAPYHHGIVLCGSMFGCESNGEWLRRHRNFETSWLMFQPQCAHRRGIPATTITRNAFVTAPKFYPSHGMQTTFAIGQLLMGINWMNRHEITQAIPPAYSEFIGLQMIEQL